MQGFYKQDLAHVHDIGYGDHARKAAAEICKILANNNILDRLIVELGCGSGISALEFARRGYKILGIDISSAMVDLARARVPQAEFYKASLFKIDLPPCAVVTAIGECLNYLFDPDNQDDRLQQLFERIYQALMPGGLFIFDVAEPGLLEKGDEQHFTEGHDWLVLVEKEENLEQSTLTRRIITLRKIGEQYRRDDEVHHIRLYRSTDLAHKLRQAGFKIQSMRSYGDYQLPRAHAAFVARKP